MEIFWLLLKLIGLIVGAVASGTLGSYLLEKRGWLPIGGLILWIIAVACIIAVPILFWVSIGRIILNVLK